MSAQHFGSCMCGAVRFVINCDLPQPTFCHCTKCRKQSGHVHASADIPKHNLEVYGQADLVWYLSSEEVRRGFCRVCGSSLFWEAMHRDWIGVAMGAFDGPTGTKAKTHMFVGTKGDYYDITDRLQRHEG